MMVLFGFPIDFTLNIWFFEYLVQFLVNYILIKFAWCFYKVYYLLYLMLLLASIYGGRIPCLFILSVCFQLLFFEVIVLILGMELIVALNCCNTAKKCFSIDSISFFRISVLLCNASFLLLLT